MKIRDVRAYPASFPIPPANRVVLGIGTAIKRDAVVVKVTTDEGLTGWGEAHHGRVEVVAGTPEHFSSFLKSEVERWARVVREANIKAD
jgi:L-alanine-DL-glutamate epimerase-like enolase superfamily enzyme